MAAKKGTATKKTTTTKTEAKTAEENQTQETQQTETGVTEDQAPTETGDTTQESGEQTSPETGGDTTPPTPEPTTQSGGDEQGNDPAEEETDVLSVKLNAYIENMAPNKMVEQDEIIRNQLRLRSIVNLLMATPAESFNDAMKSVVKKIRAERKGVFSERLIFRGFPQIKIARSERQKLETLVSLLLATADAQQPAKVKDVVDMNVVYRYVKNDEQQQKLQSYYGG
jgi:hypothetical protein